MSRTPVTVDVVSDVVCPWCYIGQKRLQHAVAALPEIDVEIRWRPYQLDPTIPTEGKDRRRYMIDKFGSEERINQIHERIEALGRAEGIDFAFDRIMIAPNTLDAHRVIRWAGGVDAGTQDRLVQRLFALNFEEGGNVGDPEVLATAAGRAGMDEALVRTLLPTDADRREVTEEIGTAARMGITGVPCFILAGKYAVMGAQETETLVDTLRKVAAEATPMSA